MEKTPFHNHTNIDKWGLRRRTPGFLRRPEEVPAGSSEFPQETSGFPEEAGGSPPASSWFASQTSGLPEEAEGGPPGSSKIPLLNHVDPKCKIQGYILCCC